MRTSENSPLEKENIEEKLLITRFSMDLELLYLQHRKDFYQGTLVANSTLFALLIAHFEKLQSPTEVERTLFLYLGVLLLLGILLSGMSLVLCLIQLRQYSQARLRLESPRLSHAPHHLSFDGFDKKHWKIFEAFSFLAYTTCYVFLVTCATILLWLFAKSSLNSSSSFYSNITLYILDFRKFISAIIILYVLGFVSYILYLFVRIIVTELVLRWKYK